MTQTNSPALNRSLLQNTIAWWSHHSSRWLVLIAIVIGVGLRLFLAAAYYGNSDQSSYEIVAQIVRRGGNIYAETSRYNYTPIWATILSGLSVVAEALHLQFHFIVRSFLTIIDVVNALLIGQIAMHALGQSSSRGWARYLLNPVAILIVGYHGQFENLAMLPLLWATWLWTRRPDAPPRKLIWLLGTLSLLIKHDTVFGVWMLFVFLATSKKRAVLILLSSIAIFVAIFLPYLPAGSDSIVQNVFLYRGIATYGLGQLVSPPISILIFVAGMGLLPFLAKDRLRLNQPKALELSFVALLTLIFGISDQYFILPVIFGSIYASIGYWLYTTVVTVFLLSSPYNLQILSIPPIGGIPWLVTVGWLISYGVARANHRPRPPQKRLTKLTTSR